MAFGNFEFPNANVYDSDLREVLRTLRELIDSYNEMLSLMLLCRNMKAISMLNLLNCKNRLMTLTDSTVCLLS